MTGRRAIVGLCMLCAMLVSAVAAQGASAAGTTGYTCVKGAGTLRGEHCLEEGSAAAEYGHVAYTGTTEATLTNEKTLNETKEARPAELRTVVGGVGITLKATEVHAEGTITNEEVAGEMVAKGEAPLGIHFEHVTNPTQGCEVGQPGHAGTVTTKPVKATTAGQEMFVKFEPVTPSLFAEFEMTGANCPTFITEHNPIKVFGSVKAVPHGATLEFKEEEITTAGTLRMFSTVGPKAGLEGAATIKARANSTQATTPIAATT